MKFTRLNEVIAADNGMLFGLFTMTDGMLWWKEERNIVLFKHAARGSWFVLADGEKVDELSAYKCHKQWVMDQSIRDAQKVLQAHGGFSA